ncbi:MAG: nuclear transport factor 2 family protein [Acidimicrobiia bacterium]|nr:nuclear transport factor 2 family protein [Acidimicrobiia bacterium]
MDDIEAIKQLKARYFRLMDIKDWDGMREVFADDVYINTTGSGGRVVQGADDFMAGLRSLLADVVTVHHGHMPEIELTSDTTATGIWALQDLLRWPDGRELYGYGHYHEEYEKVDGRWRIKKMTLTRLRTDRKEGPTGQ